MNRAAAAVVLAACADQAEREASTLADGFVGGSLSQNYGSTFQPYLRDRRIGATGPLDVDPTPRNLEQLRLEDACMRAKGYQRRPTS